MEIIRNKETHNLKEVTKRGKNKQISDETNKKAKMVNLNPTIRIITLNVNSLNMLLKRLSDWTIKQHTNLGGACKKLTLNIKIQII